MEKGIGGIMLAGFASLPVIQMLVGTREEDLSPAELKECWANGSLGATRVDRAGSGQDMLKVSRKAQEEMKKMSSEQIKSMMTPCKSKWKP